MSVDNTRLNWLRTLAASNLSSGITTLWQSQEVVEIIDELLRLRALPRERAVGELDADQKRLCELMDICRPHVDIGLEVRAELRRALIRLYRIAALSQKEPL